MPTPNQNDCAGLRRKLMIGGSAALMLAVAYLMSFGPAVAVAQRLEKAFKETGNTDVSIGLSAVRAFYHPVVLGIVRLPEPLRRCALTWCEFWLPPGSSLWAADEDRIRWYWADGSSLAFYTR